MTDREWGSLDVGDRVWLAWTCPPALGTVLAVSSRSILIAWDGADRVVFRVQHPWMLDRARLAAQIHK